MSYRSPCRAIVAAAATLLVGCSNSSGATGAHAPGGAEAGVPADTTLDGGPSEGADGAPAEWKADGSAPNGSAPDGGAKGGGPTQSDAGQLGAPDATPPNVPFLETYLPGLGTSPPGQDGLLGALLAESFGYGVALTSTLDLAVVGRESVPDGDNSGTFTWVAETYLFSGEDGSLLWKVAGTGVAPQLFGVDAADNIYERDDYGVHELRPSGVEVWKTAVSGAQQNGIVLPDGTTIAVSLVLNPDGGAFSPMVLTQLLPGGGAGWTVPVSGYDVATIRPVSTSSAVVILENLLDDTVVPTLATLDLSSGQLTVVGPIGLPSSVTGDTVSVGDVVIGPGGDLFAVLYDRTKLAFSLLDLSPAGALANSAVIQLFAPQALSIAGLALTSNGLILAGGMTNAPDSFAEQFSFALADLGPLEIGGMKAPTGQGSWTAIETRGSAVALVGGFEDALMLAKTSD